jgi:hypothetical protein
MSPSQPEMVTVTVDEHLNSLLAVYQYAEKIYCQMVSDVVAAEIRRNEAEMFKIDAFEMLQKAREKFGTLGTETSSEESKQSMSQNEQSELKLNGSSSVSAIDRTKKRIRKHPAKTENDVSRSPISQPVHSPSAPKIGPSLVSPKFPLLPLTNQDLLPPRSPNKETITGELLPKVGPVSPTSSPLRTKRTFEEKPMLSRSPLSAADQEMLSPRKSIRAMIAEAKAQKGALPGVPPIGAGESNNEKPETNPPAALSADIVISETPTPTHERRMEPHTRKKPRGVVVALKAYSQPKPTLEITRGRSREWLENNFNYEAFGLVKKFYEASFGTKTNERAQKVTVRTIVLTDEWNDLAKDTSMIQEMYVVKGTGENSGSVGPAQRDRAAHALVDPPQSLPIALFFAPKKALKTSDIFYVGHWKVVDGNVLDPPEMMNGQLRQTIVKLSFAGVDKNIVDTFNRDT